MTKIFTNFDWVDSVDDLVMTFNKRQGLNGEDTATLISDLICNLLHWARHHGEDSDPRLVALDAMRRGISSYVTESYIDYDAEEVDELGPEAFVEISVSCNGESWDSSTREGSTIATEE